MESVTFHYIVGNSSNGAETPDNGENLDFRILNSSLSSIKSVRIYSGGVAWSNGTTWLTYTYTFTDTERDTGCYLQWYQNSASGGNYDNYGITNIILNPDSSLKVRLKNLPSSSTDDNRLWRDSLGFIKVNTSTPNATFDITNDMHIMANAAAWNNSVGKGIFMR